MLLADLWEFNYLTCIFLFLTAALATGYLFRRNKADDKYDRDNAAISIALSKEGFNDVADMFMYDATDSIIEYKQAMKQFRKIVLNPQRLEEEVRRILKYQFAKRAMDPVLKKQLLNDLKEVGLVEVDATDPAEPTAKVKLL